MKRTEMFMILSLCYVLGEYFLCTPSAAHCETFLRKVGRFVSKTIPFLAVYLLAKICGCAVPIGWCIACIVVCGVAGGLGELGYFFAEKWSDEAKASVLRYGLQQGSAIGMLAFAAAKMTLPSNSLPLRVEQALPYILYFLCLLKPANVTFKVFFVHFQRETGSKETEGAKSQPGAGALIGSLERLLTGMFVLLGQYSAVGLTMTAKSIARYEQITKDPAFAEYYLIGTLYSMLYTVALYAVIFKFLC